MSISTLTNTINRIQRDIADLNKKISDEKKKEASNTGRINQIQKSISKSTPVTSVNSKLMQIERIQRENAGISSKQADLQKQLANKVYELNKQQINLSKEQEREQRKLADLEKKRERERLEYQQRITRELKEQKELVLSLTNAGSHSKHTGLASTEENELFDVFISHASEDKDDFVRPLAEELVRIGVKVWYDEFSLKWGDSLRVSIDKGLSNSKFGVIVISSSFIGKKWPEYEVNGLVAREMAGGKVILPIWHKVSKSEVIKYSPTLADKLAMNSSVDEIADIAKQLKSLL
ncbi:TIR domain-containing protein [Bacillus sp. 3255]|uniref:TIR domain-containing protein n=1 Tax=Bacillus sp. 3255 TaxID=2817904 RepID=UPI00285A3015|nr:TIR domain-containing protein [Bacillus sp. 3255]MDR6883004.1 uncharacterized protein YeeX (DUF496 family) [Bacillus sp. 3255]